jgi:predicted DNA-binding protein YlxM (UPF0122 family)
MNTEPEKPRIFNAADWMSKGDAARARGVSRQAIWELVRRKRLSTIVFAGRLYVDRSEVMNFKRRPRGPASQYLSKEEREHPGKLKKKRKRFDPSKWLSMIEAARAAGVTRQVIGDLIRRRRLRTFVVGSKTLVLRSGLENFMRERRSPKPKSKPAKKK